MVILVADWGEDIELQQVKEAEGTAASRKVAFGSHPGQGRGPCEILI